MIKYSLFRVNMPPDIHLALQPVLESGFVSEGPQAKVFENLLQTYLCNPYTAIVNSGTSALTIALRLAGVGPGDEVISTPMTCLATNEPIHSLGARVVWCDIDPTTGCMDPSKVEALITPKTKAIMFVDWAGTPCELEALNDVAHKHGLKTIEDAAHSFGARYMGSKVGSLLNKVDYVCFSFQAIKHMTTVDGGAIACQSKEDYDRAVLLRWFGCQRGHNASPIKWTGDVVEYGYKMHMNDVNATIGIESLKTIDEKIDRHKRNGALLTKLLKDIPEVEVLRVPEHAESAYWIFTILLKGAKHREQVSELLTGAGVGNNIVHTRNDAYSLFAESRVDDLPGMDSFGERMLNIPCGWWLSDDDIERVFLALRMAVIGSDPNGSMCRKDKFYEDNND